MRGSLIPGLCCQKAYSDGTQQIARLSLPLWRWQEPDLLCYRPSDFEYYRAYSALEETLEGPAIRSVQGTHRNETAVVAMVDVSKWSFQNDWENPAIYERNRGRMHVPLRSYKSKDAALRYYTEGPKQAPSERVLTLNSSSGAWKFKLYDRPENVQPNFWTSEFDDGSWNQVKGFRLIAKYCRCALTCTQKSVSPPKHDCYEVL